MSKPKKTKNGTRTGHPKSCRCGGNSWLYPEGSKPGVPTTPIRCPGTGTSTFLKPGPLPGDLGPSGQDLAAGEGGR